jgi:hypothetical protein
LAGVCVTCWADALIVGRAKVREAKAKIKWGRFVLEMREFFIGRGNYVLVFYFVLYLD